MKINEPQCVILKRRGAKHVNDLLAGKNLKEELSFWADCTMKLKNKVQKDRQIYAMPESELMACHEKDD